MTKKNPARPGVNYQKLVFIKNLTRHTPGRRLVVSELWYVTLLS